MHISTKQHLSRRHVLRGASGVALGLPLLDAMNPAFAAEMASPKRFVGVSYSLGIHSPNLVPKDAGFKYTPSRYLKPLQDIRNKFTVISGTSHPGVGGGHTAEGSIWSACPNKRGGAKNTISLDQLLAKHQGHETRFPSLVINTSGSTSPSYTENGAMIPAEQDAKKLFNKLFSQDSKTERQRQASLARGGQSIMDIIRNEAKSLERKVGHGDKEKLDEWFTSVNELEKRLEDDERWAHTPKPKVAGSAPTDLDYKNAASLQSAMLDIVSLALQTDSSRFVTLHCTHNIVNAIEGVDESYHGLSHHGLDDEKLGQLGIVEQNMINEWADFIRGLAGKKQSGGNLLQDTSVILTSNLGNASSHNNKNMPVLFAGGRFKHGQHLAFDQKNNYPLPNLYLNVLQHAGLGFDSFATSTGTMKGITV